MKPASIISIIIAVLLVIVGLVTCFIAQNMAQANGEYLFTEQVDGTSIVTQDLSEEVSKIALVVSDAKINIYGRCDREDALHKSSSARIEFINFKENYYSLTNKNNLVSFDEVPDITSMLKFWENGFSFKGMRYILNIEQIKEFLHKTEDEEKDAEKQINIYLTEAMQIKSFDIKSTGTCSLTIENMRTETDYNVSAENITVDVESTSTSSALNVNRDPKTPAQAVTIKVNRAILSYLTVNAQSLDIDAVSMKINTEMKVGCETGDIRVGLSNRLAAYNLDIHTTGRILVGGEDMSNPFNGISGSGNPMLNVTAGAADVNFYENSAASAEEKDG